MYGSADCAQPIRERTAVAFISARSGVAVSERPQKPLKWLLHFVRNEDFSWATAC